MRTNVPHEHSLVCASSVEDRLASLAVRSCRSTRDGGVPDEKIVAEL
jgi:hypothetical protein